MKRKFIVGLIIFGMVFSGVNVNFKSVKAGNPYFLVRGTITNVNINQYRAHLQIEEILYKNIPSWIGDLNVGDTIEFSYYYPENPQYPPDLHVGDRVELRCSDWDGIFYLVWSEGDYVKIIGDGEKLQVNLWIDKGCGATYNINDTITIYFEVNKACYITLKVTTSQGTKTNISNEYVSAGTHYKWGCW